LIIEASCYLRCQYPPRPRPSGNTLYGAAPPEPKCGDSGSPRSPYCSRCSSTCCGHVPAHSARYQIRQPKQTQDSPSTNAWPAWCPSASLQSSSSRLTWSADRSSAALASRLPLGARAALDPYFAVVLVISAGAALLLVGAPRLSSSGRRRLVTIVVSRTF